MITAQTALAQAVDQEIRRESAEAGSKEVEEGTARMFKEITVVPPDLYKAREFARVKAEAVLTRPRKRFVVATSKGAGQCQRPAGRVKRR